MVEALQIYHLNINCRDLDRSLAFYKAIGFRELIDLNRETVVPDGNDPRAPRLEGPGLGPALGLPPDVRARARLLVLGEDSRATKLDLIEWIDPPAEGHPYPALNHLGIARVCFRVRDAWAAWHSLRDLGAEPFTEPYESHFAGGRQLFFCCRDPDGTVIEFMEFLSG